MESLRQFVEQNRRWFAGRGHETDESLNAAEKALGISLPGEIRWLLKEYGYWHATGISSLEESVADTRAARESLGLPHRFVVLDNYQDGGGILIDTESADGADDHLVYNVGWESIPNDTICDELVFPSYLEYVRDQLQLQQDFIDPEFVDYDPDDDEPTTGRSSRTAGR